MVKRERHTAGRLLFLATALIFAAVLAAYMYHEETAEDFLSVRISFVGSDQEQTVRCQPGTGEKELLIFLPAGAREARWEAAEGREFYIEWRRAERRGDAAGG